MSQPEINLGNKFFFQIHFNAEEKTPRPLVSFSYIARQMVSRTATGWENYN